MDAAPLSCRGCWRAVHASHQPCGCALCGDCVAALARAAFQAPALLLPLRCCRLPVAPASLQAALAPQELAYYLFMVHQQSDQKRRRIRDHGGDRDGTPWTTRCDFCAAPTRLETPQDAAEKLQRCGHVYCASCVASLRMASGPHDHAFCCKELETAAVESQRPLVGDGTRHPGAMTTAAAVVAAPTPRVGVLATATTTTTAATKGKGKRKQQTQQQLDANVVNLLDSDDDGTGVGNGACVRSGGGGGGAAALDEPEMCHMCSEIVDFATNRFRAGCGHIFCRGCLHVRSLRALQNEEQGSIGFPLRCCRALVSLDVMRAVLSKRNFVKYEALVAKRGDAAIPKPPRASKRKAAAALQTTAAAAAAASKKAKRTATTETVGEEEAKDEDEEPAECVACMTDVEATEDRLTGPCGHVYCVTCLTMMAKQSLEDRALVPIRCCQQEFPIDYVKRVLTRPQMAQYDRFLKEKDWRTSDLKSDKEYAAMVKAINGKQCPACGIGVQKISGCDAIRCLRGHLFCFACESAPCTCGRTRLESYGWVPPGTQPPPPAIPGLFAVPGLAAVAGLPGFDRAAFLRALAAPRARVAELMGEAFGRAQVAVAPAPAPRPAPAAAAAAAARPKPKMRRR